MPWHPDVFEMKNTMNFAMGGSMKSSFKGICILTLFAVLALSGCSGNQQGYRKAFDSNYALTQNQVSFSQPSEAVFKIVKQNLTQQGFTVENADLKSGVVKAVRNMADKNDSEISYNIHFSADISEVAGGDTTVSLAASQQTILHRSTTTWWHLLWILPIIPTGTEYQTLVVKEGNITDPGFYTDFFNSLKVAVTKYDVAVKAAAAKKAEEDRIAAEKAARLKAEADAIAAAESARIYAERAAKLRAEAEAKAAAEKAEVERIAAEIAAKMKAEAEAKAAAQVTPEYPAAKAVLK
jgi:hypothetical protein